MKWNAYANNDDLAMEYQQLQRKRGRLPGRSQRAPAGGSFGVAHRQGRLAQQRLLRPADGRAVAPLRLRARQLGAGRQTDHPLRRRQSRRLHQARQRHRRRQLRQLDPQLHVARRRPVRRRRTRRGGDLRPRPQRDDDRRKLQRHRARGRRSKNLPEEERRKRQQPGYLLRSRARHPRPDRLLAHGRDQRLRIRRRVGASPATLPANRPWASPAPSPETEHGSPLRRHQRRRQRRGRPLAARPRSRSSSG